MRGRIQSILVVALWAVAAMACSFLSGAVSSVAKTAAPALGDMATAAAISATELPSRSTAAPEVHPNIDLPADTVPYRYGQIYAIGQAVKDDKTEVIVRVDDVRFDSASGGLDSGETWCVITVTLGNAGAEPYTVSSVGSFGVSSKSTSRTYGERIIAAITANLISVDNQLDTEVGPGSAYQGILPVALPEAATGLRLKVAPIEYMGSDLSFLFDLGK